MEQIATKKVKRKKLKAVGLLLVFAFLGIIFSIGYFFVTMPIKNIVIIGTTLITDNEIIKKCNIEDYPPIFKLSSTKMKKEILTLPLVENVKISKSIFGKLTIEVKEEKVLFLNKSKNTLVLSNGKEIENTSHSYRMPILINYVPDKIYSKLISGLSQVDYDIVSSIGEIEYSPTNNGAGSVIDDSRFYLRMNDGNAVVMNIVNIKRLNNYNTIYASIFSATDGEKGTFYLDSIIEENTYFQSYASEKQEKLDAEAAKEEGSEDKDERTNESR